MRQSAGRRHAIGGGAIGGVLATGPAAAACALFGLTIAAIRAAAGFLASGFVFASMCEMDRRADAVLRGAEAASRTASQLRGLLRSAAEREG